MTRQPLAAMLAAIGEWRSLVARLLWEQDVAGSNPVSPTNKIHRVDTGDSTKPYPVTLYRLHERSYLDMGQGKIHVQKGRLPLGLAELPMQRLNLHGRPRLGLSPLKSRGCVLH